ncbi:hypothetical protein GCM10018793_11870 [Streptomyces sulfonofaciens]|uniref:Uncharacterized protein n=1 Tax=Streptomyces sulfonofaciens TaxID=68272 RepID=A0A919FWN3_9ACTN|nr:hypothetical protein [Streptomyces sulfonofaciens]GHH73319.1 hypothetical protein GCM10018793_11870 [Streptomyces sulfonofaciens]
MARGPARAAAAAETVAWAAPLLVFWLMLVSTVDRWELAVGAAAALLSGAAARGARRAVTRR